ncbi:hypothetical protein KI387_027116, partial [Taxus chinensis]
SIVLGLDCTFLSKDIGDELAVEGGVGLTSSLESSGFLDFGYTFLGKDEEGVPDVEGNANGG